MTTTFADISHYQGSVDLAAYQAAGFDRIAMKATGGALDGSLRFVDDTFGVRWRRAGALGLARVAYHFARSNNHGGDEFDWFLSQVNQAGGLGPADVLCYDTEDNRTAATWSLARQRAVEFTRRAVAAGYPHGWVYSGRWFLEPAGLLASDLPAGWRNLWISDTTPQQIELPPGWTVAQLVACQYTDHASLPGIPSTDADFVIKEWIMQPLTDADAELVVHKLVPYLQEITTGAGNSVDNNPLLQQFRDAQDAALGALGRQMTALAADLAAVKATVAGLSPAGSPVDAAAVAQALLDAGLPNATALQVAEHLQLKAI